MIKSIVSIFLTSFCFGQQTFYKDREGKLFSKEDYEKYKEVATAKFNEYNLTTITKENPNGYKLIENLKVVKNDNDSIITEFKLVSLSNKIVNMLTIKPKIVGQIFPFEKFKTINGHQITIEDLQNKPTMINFWFTKCMPCVKEIPLLNEIATRYAGKVNFIAITFDSKSTVKNFLTEKKINFIHVVNAGKILEEFEIDSYPKNIFVNKNRIIDCVYNPLDKIANGGNSLLAEDSDEFAVILDRLLK